MFVNDPKENSEELIKFKQAAKELKNQIYFVYAGITDRLHEKLAEYAFVHNIHLPTIRLLDTAKDNTKYRYEGDLKELDAAKLG